MGGGCGRTPNGPQPAIKDRPLGPVAEVKDKAWTLDQAARKMTPDQLAEAQRLARELKPSSN